MLIKFVLNHTASNMTTIFPSLVAKDIQMKQPVHFTVTPKDKNE